MNRAAIFFALSIAGTSTLFACGGGSSGDTAAPVAAPIPPPGGSPSPPPGSSPPPPAPPPSTEIPTLSRTVVMGGLQNPWDLAFTPDGAMLYTERARGLSVQRADGTTAQIFRPADFLAEGQSGMQGVTIDPAFATNRTIYVYMSSNASGTGDNRVLRLTVDAGYTAVANRTDIVTGISYKNTWLNGDPAGRGAHNGGRIRFGPDGFLYVTTGDNHSGPLPQNLNALGSKVLRVNRDGAAAAGNNTPAGGDPRIYAYGFRNPQGITFRPANGQPYISEHGPGHSDEVTALSPGVNGGWDPLCLNGANYCGYTSNQASGTPTPMTDTAKFPAARAPLWNNQGRSQGIAASEFLRGPQWKAYDGALAVAFMAGNRVEILRLDMAGALVATTPAFNTLGIRVRAAVLGPDGNLYLTTDGKSGGDEVWRVVPS